MAKNFSIALKIYNIYNKNSIERSNSKQQKQTATAEATDDLIGNKVADKLTSVPKKKPAKELLNDETKEDDVEIATPKKRYICPEERKQIIEELRLVPKKYV